MTTCYEHLRKKTDEDKEMFKRLENYLRAIEDNKVDEYHNKHNRKEEKRIDEY